MKKNYGFKEVSEEISAELILTRAAEMEKWLTALEMEQDLSVAGMLDSSQNSFFTDEDMADILFFEGEDNEILTQAAQSLRMLDKNNPTIIPPMEEYRVAHGKGCEPAGEDCAEWLQLHQKSVASHVKSYARYLKESGYELDDLIQEANLAIFNGWTAYDPATGPRDAFCWYIVYNHMRGLSRKAISQKRNFLLTESRDAVRLAHSDFMDSCFDGAVTWSSTVQQSQFEADFAVMDEMTAAMEALEEDKREILFMLAEGYTQTEIGLVTNRSQGLVSYHAAEGRKVLKAAIA